MANEGDDRMELPPSSGTPKGVQILVKVEAGEYVSVNLEMMVIVPTTPTTTLRDIKVALRPIIMALLGALPLEPLERYDKEAVKMMASAEDDASKAGDDEAGPGKKG